MSKNIDNPNTTVPDSNRSMSLRFQVVLALILLATVLVVGRLAYVQIFDTALADASSQQRFRVMELPAERGHITDSSNTVLAKSVQSYDIVADQTKVKNYERTTKDGGTEKVTVDDTANYLAKTLNLDTQKVKKALKGDSKYSRIAQNVTPELEKEIKAKKIPGIDSQESMQRIYPNGAVAGNVLGFINDQGAVAGIEATENSRLAGTDGQISYEQGADGIRIPNATVSETLPKNGETVKLTIDGDIQWAAQQEIEAQVKKRGAEWGNIVVIEAKTGKVIALADSGTVDPNSPGAENKTRTISTPFEPGSTEKIITAAAAIEEQKTTPLEKIEVPTEYSVNNQTFTDAFEHGKETRTFAGIIGDSMNTGTVMVGQRLSKEQRYDYLHKFGIGQYTGIDLPGESAGDLPSWQTWDGRQEYAVLFGQGLSQTALQTAMVYQTIANDGVRLKPQIVDSYIDTDGKEHKVEKSGNTRVVSETTAKEVQDIVESVVTEGGAPQAQLAGYRVGGKTGTAEAPAENGVGFDGVTASFVGMAPMDDPQYVVGVTLQRPQGKVYGVTAVPSFKKIMTQVLTKKQVPLSNSEPVRLRQKYN